MILPGADPGSFRDPGGQIFVEKSKVYRTINKSKSAIYEACKKSGIYDFLEKKKLLLPLKECKLSDFSSLDDNIKYVLEHPKLAFISYPYEWSFALHRQAALLHLDLHIEILSKGFTLIDASAYNVQFQGTKPVFIDHLSIEPYKEGDIWIGHQQFCTQFLNPLLLWSLMGISPNAWFRGSLEGIPIEEMAKILPFRKKLSWTVFSHVTLQAMFQRNALNNNKTEQRAKSVKLSKTSLLGILTGLRSYIEKLKGPGTNTVWANYENSNTYSDKDAEIKKHFIQEMVSATKPALLYDIGCNTGNYSNAALEAGAKYVVGFDYDYTTLDFAFDRFSKEKKPFTPIWLDAANPSPAQGWAQSERMGMAERGNPDALIALAFIHHIVIGRNIPMSMALDWLTGLAPVGVIEFPNKEDPMVQKLLNIREDIFPDYNEENFIETLGKKANIVSTKRVTENGRLLVWYATQ